VTDDQVANSRLSPAEAHSIIRQRLERLLVPRNLHPSDVHRLIQQLHLHTYSPGEIIVPSGVCADCLGLIVQGQVAVRPSSRRSGRAEVILLPGSTFGEAMLARGRPSPATLQALSRCDVWFLRRADLQALAVQRRAAQRGAVLRKIRPWAGSLVGICLVAVLALSLPVVRQTAALVPMGLGQWCSQQHYDPCTERAWTLAAGLGPADANPWLALGNLYFAQGEMGAAERSFEQVLALAPESAEGYNNLGVIYARQGEHEQAVSAFQKALELQPGTAVVEQNLALSLLALEHYDEALGHYQAALALAEPMTSTLVNSAIAYYEAGQPDEAVETAREALRRDENLASAYEVMGAAALQARRPKDALPDLQQAVALDSDYCQAHFCLGLVYQSLGRTAEAIAAFEQALSTADDEATRVRIRRYLNELYEQESQHSRPQVPAGAGLPGAGGERR
jgi:tetratricopeptide (TPR) repeat protein